MGTHTIYNIKKEIDVIEKFYLLQLAIEFFEIYLKYLKYGITKMFLDRLMGKLGFAERELLVEFSYPTQRFVLSRHNKEVSINE